MSLCLERAKLGQALTKSGNCVEFKRMRDDAIMDVWSKKQQAQSPWAWYISVAGAEGSGGERLDTYAGALKTKVRTQNWTWNLWGDG